MSPALVIMTVITLAAVSLAFMYYTRSASLHALIADASMQSENAKKSVQKNDYDLKQTKEKLEETREQNNRLEKSLEDARHKLQVAAQEKTEWKKALETRSDSERRQLEHLTEQVKVITEQLGEAVADKQRLAREVAEGSSAAKNEVRNQVKPLQDEVRQLRQVNESMEKELRKAKSDVEKAVAVLKTVDPSLTKKFRQRIASMEQLIVSMRGLRELAEERAQNYELALRKLAVHIVGPAHKDGNFGALVGEALEKIGGTILDSEVNAPHAEFAAPTSAPTPSVQASH